MQEVTRRLEAPEAMVVPVPGVEQPKEVLRHMVLRLMVRAGRCITSLEGYPTEIEILNALWLGRKTNAWAGVRK